METIRKIFTRLWKCKEVKKIVNKLADRLVLYRAKHRLSQKELAEKCGVSAQTIHSIESGYQKPSKVTLAKILMVVGGDRNEI